MIAILLAHTATAWGEPADFPSASLTPRFHSGWDESQDKVDPTAPLDEAKAGETEAGTPVTPRGVDDFPAEGRDVFPQVDSLPGPDGNPVPFNYLDAEGKLSDDAHSAVRGKNTWILWGEGNEVFWNWVQQHGYGLTDFLVLLDSRDRDSRFARAGLINQPGMKSRSERDERILGLYLDQADEGVLLPGTAAKYPGYSSKPLFKVGDEKIYREVLSNLPNDGLNPSVYGYPSGILGLRLFLNPDFFGATDDAARARDYWQEKIIKPNDDAYYAVDKWVSKDPKLVRPFRVSMSCGFCHISPHPLFPPVDPEKPEWKNLSSTIGDQYWSPVSTFTNLQGSDSFLFQFLNSQQPGTIDTSLVSTDHINNANTITAIFDVPARLTRADENVAELQSSANLRIPHKTKDDPSNETNPRHVPRVLVDGSDSVGVWGALSRVYLNIGAYSEQWKRVHNTVVGFSPQRPFDVATAYENSVYWQTTEKYRIPYIKAFFTYLSKDRNESVTRPMHLADNVEIGRPIIEAEKAEAAKGREVFIQNCAICHSSKQPDGGSHLAFDRKWKDAPPLGKDGKATLTLPYDFVDWSAFIESTPYKKYVEQMQAKYPAPPSEQVDPFLKDNFLSNEIRIPVTLVGTNSGRAVATNAMTGQVWDNFSSADYKKLAAVGDIRFFNPFSHVKADTWGNNDSYTPPGKGPGYYRPASLISLWATAPYLHNNALGVYNHKPSIQGRLEAFDDGIDKLFSNEKRDNVLVRRPGDLRATQVAAAGSDEGFIYRTTVASYIEFTPQFIRPLVSGVLGPILPDVVTTYLWWGLAAVFLVFAVLGRNWHAGILFALAAIATAALLAWSRVDTIYPLLWALPALLTGGAFLLWFVARRRWIGRIVFLLLIVPTIMVQQDIHTFVAGGSGPLRLGPIPPGTPVNLLMNINPEASISDLAGAVFGLTRGLLRINKENLEGDAAWTAFEAEAAIPLMRASKCPDFVLDRGHWFAENLTPDQKNQLKAFLKTL